MGKGKSKLNKMNWFDWLNYTLIGLLTLAFVYPIIVTLSLSLSDGSDPMLRVTLLPVNFNLQSYQFIFSDGTIFRYYWNSIFYATVSTFISLTLTAMMAFPFTLPNFRGKTFFNLYMIVTMFFGGGLIPYFVLVSSLGLVNSVWVMLIPGAVGPFTVIVFRTFFSKLPAELRESAYMDGAGHYRVLFRIILPCSKALLATFALFGMVGTWNNWFTPLLFLRDPELQPIQMMLRRMLILMEFRDAENMDLQMMLSLVTGRTMRSAAVMVTIFPILCVYPFLQKHFAKGVMVGSLKG